jgi:hypothetical protein
MNRHSAIGCGVAVLLTFASGASPPEGRCPGKEIDAHGIVHFIDVEGGCWQFEDDAGRVYQPTGGPYYMYCDGIEGNLQGCLRPDLVSICQVGTIVEVLEFAPDPFAVHGTVRFIDVEGGCWQFLADDGTPYEPVDGPAEMFVDGQTGVMTAFELCGLASFCQVGQLVQVLSFRSDGACDADFDGDGLVSVGDLVTLINAWGGPDGDLTGDGVTDVNDLVVLIQHWGPCAR